jgi:rod shape-determining protein MreC
LTTLRQKLREAGIVAAVLAGALIMLRQSARHPGELSTLDRGILAAVSPIQSALSVVTRGTADVAGRYVDLVHVRAANEELRRANSKLSAELIEARRAVADNARLQKLLGLRDALPSETLAARVIAIDASPFFRVARVALDRGEGDVKRGMPVISADGVVGRISRVADGTSDVQLAVDPKFALDVFLPRTGGRGILRGKPGENGYRCAIEYLVKGEDAKAGDVVVTSGLGGSFPRDVPVGKISKVTKSEAGLYQEVEVTPEVDFGRLSEVLVVVAPAPANDPDAPNGRKAPAPARGLSVYR